VVDAGVDAESEERQFSWRQTIGASASGSSRMTPGSPLLPRPASALDNPLLQKELAELFDPAGIHSQVGPNHRFSGFGAKVDLEVINEARDEAEGLGVQVKMSRGLGVPDTGTGRASTAFRSATASDGRARSSVGFHP